MDFIFIIESWGAEGLHDSSQTMWDVHTRAGTWSQMQPWPLCQALEHWLKLSDTRKETWPLNEFCTTDGPQPLWGYWKHCLYTLAALGLLIILVNVWDTSGVFSMSPVSAGDPGSSTYAVQCWMKKGLTKCTSH